MEKLNAPSIPVGLVYTLLIITLLFFVYMALPKSWEEATTVKKDGTLALSKEWAETIDRKKDQYAYHDLYQLIAAKNGYYSCKHCPTGKFYLKVGEVYRYGTTGIGQEGRGYSEEWLNDHLLNYVIIMTGDIAIIKTQEAILIGSYAIFPENLNRPLFKTAGAKDYWYRLVLPPGNQRLD
ncbi:MAG: hypothetical protein R2828_08870 [Saprospiraceae bacterium]